MFKNVRSLRAGNVTVMDLENTRTFPNEALHQESTDTWKHAAFTAILQFLSVFCSKSPGEYEHTEVNKITVFYFVFFLTNLHRHTKQ